MFTHRSTHSAMAAGLTCLCALFAGSASAQSARELAGVWTLLSSDTVHPDGGRTPTLGANPTGNLIFTKDGHFFWLLLNKELPKFASNNRATGTPEENAAVVRGSIAVYGTYSIVGKELMFGIEQSTFPNWRGTRQKRTLTTFTSGELKWTNPAGSTGGVAELVFRRQE
jgi:hypothetical protein